MNLQLRFLSLLVRLNYSLDPRSIPLPLSLSTLEDWELVLRFNVGIAITINNLIIPKMIEKKYGRIVHISSISGESLRGSAPYGASKAFLNAYIKVLAREVAENNIVVSGVLPGAIYAQGGHWDENSSINKNNKMTLAMFPKGSGLGDTKAKSTIWENWTKFKNAVDASVRESTKLVKVAESGDMNAFAKQVRSTGKTCRGCHQSFRERN